MTAKEEFTGHTTSLCQIDPRKHNMKILLATIIALLQAAMTSSRAPYPDPNAPPPPSKVHPVVSYWRRQSYLRAVMLMGRILPGGHSRQKHYVNPVSSSVSARSLTTIQHPDAGECRSIINEGILIYTAQHFVSGKTVDLAFPLKPKEITCQHSQPTNRATGSCILVGYPHGAWIVQTLEDKNRLPQGQRDGCVAMTGLVNRFRCWNYVVVPGACVFKDT